MGLQQYRLHQLKENRTVTNQKRNHIRDMIKLLNDPKENHNSYAVGEFVMLRKRIDIGNLTLLLNVLLLLRKHIQRIAIYWTNLMELHWEHTTWRWFIQLSNTMVHHWDVFTHTLFQDRKESINSTRIFGNNSIWIFMEQITTESLNASLFSGERYGPLCRISRIFRNSNKSIISENWCDTENPTCEKGYLSFAKTILRNKYFLFLERV